LGTSAGGDKSTKIFYVLKIELIAKSSMKLLTRL
jgi:hypothetical protein